MNSCVTGGSNCLGQRLRTGDLGSGGGRAEILAPLYCIILICKMGIIKKAQLRRLKLAIKIKISLNNLNCFAKSK